MFKVGDETYDTVLRCICKVTKIPWLSNTVEVEYVNGGRNWVEKRDIRKLTKLEKALK